MSHLKIVLPFFVGTFVYSLFGLLAGPKGILPMRELEMERTRVRANLEALSETHDGLETALNNLSSDADTISVYAHELGYVREGERLIKLAGFSGGIDRKLVPGTVVTARIPSSLPEWICKLAGLVFGVLTYTLIAWRFPSERKERSVAVARYR